MKIIIDNKIPFIRQRLEPVADVVYADPSGITPQMVQDADALIVRTRTECNEGLLAGSNVKLVVTATIGTDHIDTAWCEANGIKVCNAAGCNAPGVAQYVWSSLLRNGFDVRKDTLGIVGKGNIGSIVADWGRKGGAKVIVCDPPRQRAGLEDEDYIPLEKLLSEADAVTLHTPLIREGEDRTYHLISGEEMDLMKENALLVNASRGEVVDNAAWRDRIGKGKIRGIVDVWEGEPDIDPLLLQDAAVATPHIAGYSRQGKERATRMALEAVERFFGVKVDKSGLEGEYDAPSADNFSLVSVADSYEPGKDTAELRESPESFESLRSRYDYREEPRF